MHISNVKLPFYPSCEVKYGLQNKVLTLVFVLFWASLTYSIASGLPWPISSFWASLAHFLSLGILVPFYSHGPLLSLLSFTCPNYHILYFWGS